MNSGLRLHERLALEVLDSQDALAGIGPCVAIFGGARVKDNSPFYAAARETARLLSQGGLSVITGGGPGIMAAANEGAKLGANGKSVGLLILLPYEETPNPHLDIRLTFNHFASRKVAFCRHAKAFVFFPGGYGTMDELGDVLAMMVTGKTEPVPIVMYNSAYWSGLIMWMRETMLGEGLISPDHLDCLLFAEQPEDIPRDIERWYEERPALCSADKSTTCPE
jgi:uncharacterized protein (TIGR00730 family)